jgi:hypothetical protein
MARRWPRETYLVCFIYSFFFLLFLALGIAAHKIGVGVTELCGSYSGTCKWIYNTLTNVEEEVLLVEIVLAAIIGPQILTYFISGLFGCASAPRFVSTASKIGTWSLIKFLAGLAGIILAEELASLFVGRGARLNAIMQSYMLALAAFSFGAFMFGFEIGAQEFRPLPFNPVYRGLVRGLVKTHRWFTRNLPKKKKTSPGLVEVHVHLGELGQLRDRVRVDTHFHTR